MRELAERIVDKLVEHGKDLNIKNVWFSKEYPVLRKDAIKYVKEELENERV